MTNPTTPGHQFWNDYFAQTLHMTSIQEKGQLWFDMLTQHHYDKDSLDDTSYLTCAFECSVIDYYIEHETAMPQEVQKWMFEWLTQNAAFSPIILDDIVVLPYLVHLLQPSAYNLMNSQENDVATYIYRDLVSASTLTHALFATFCYEINSGQFVEHPVYAFGDDFMEKMVEAFHNHESIVNFLITYYEDYGINPPLTLSILKDMENKNSITETLQCIFQKARYSNEVELHI